MTEAEILQFINECSDVFESHGRFFFLARGAEFQQSSADKLEAFQKEIEEVLLDSQKQKFIDASNRLKALALHTSSLVAELRMYIHIKNDAMSEAWDELIAAQSATLWAIRAHDGVGKSLEPRAKRLDVLERLLFPKQIFFSTGFTVKSSECSICRKEYRDCDHIKGRIYNGEFCTRLINDADLNEVSVVEEPADKRCRALSFGEGNEMRDVITYRVLAKDKQDEQKLD